jgi:serine/threonine-protein phosphatase 2B catalytic subunit
MTLLALQYLHPEKVHLLRGSHEDSIAASYGYLPLQSEMDHKGILDAFVSMTEIFARLPCILVLNEQYMCMHGGLSPNLDFETLNQAEYLASVFSSDSSEKAANEEKELMKGVLWSEPLEQFKYQRNSAACGNIENICYGPWDVTRAFERLNAEYGLKLHTILRAHEMYPEGFNCLSVLKIDDNRKYFHPAESKPNLVHRVITIFSAPAFKKGSNKGAVLQLNETQTTVSQMRKTETELSIESRPFKNEDLGKMVW